MADFNELGLDGNEKILWKGKPMFKPFIMSLHPAVFVALLFLVLF